MTDFCGLLEIAYTAHLALSILHGWLRQCLRSVLLDLTLELGILSCFLCEEGVDKAQIQLVGVGVGIAARIAVSAGLAL